MTERERLIELLDNAVGDCNLTDAEVKIVADYLLANGVIVPPCKVGDTVYINGCFGGVAEPHKIKFMSVRISQVKTAVFFEADLLDEDGNPTGSDCSFWDHYIGESVFLTRKLAEEALNEQKKL